MRTIAPKSLWKRLLERIVDTFWCNLGRVPEKEYYIENHVGAGNSRVVEALFRANPSLAHYRDGFGNPLLILAVYEKQVEMCRLLLTLGCPIDATDAHGATALHHAVDESREIMALLLAQGAAPNIRDENGDFPIDWAEPELAMEIKRLLANSDE